MTTQASQSEAQVVIERTYRANIKDVWALWTTKEGFESWWGPQGFRADVQELDARVGGALRYEMIADSPEAIAAMKQMGQPTSHATRSRFTEVKPHSRLVLTNVIDFLPGVAAYESDVAVDFTSSGEDEDNVRRPEENDVPDAAPQAPQAGNNGAKAPGKAKPKTSDKPGQPAVQQGDDLVPVDQVKPDTLVKDTDLSWLTESFRPTTLAKCGEWPWRELAQKVPSAVTFFEGSQARTPDVILAAIRAGQSGGQTEPTPSVAEGTPAPQP
jgi:uncharacterized protein YndB with AHSA1/START domain